MNSMGDIRAILVLSACQSGEWNVRRHLAVSGKTVSECFAFLKSARRNWSSLVSTGFPVSGLTT